jgi:hypothetical protein
MIRSTWGPSSDDAGVDPAFAEPVEPQRPVGIDHHLDHERIGERGRDVGSHRGA